MPERLLKRRGSYNLVQGKLQLVVELLLLLLLLLKVGSLVPRL
jgi:hypothetical protein